MPFAGSKQIWKRVEILQRVQQRSRTTTSQQFLGLGGH